MGWIKPGLHIYIFSDVARAPPLGMYFALIPGRLALRPGHVYAGFVYIRCGPRFGVPGTIRVQAVSSARDPRANHKRDAQASCYCVCCAHGGRHRRVFCFVCACARAPPMMGCPSVQLGAAHAMHPHPVSLFSPAVTRLCGSAHRRQTNGPCRTGGGGKMRPQCLWPGEMAMPSPVSHTRRGTVQCSHRP